MTAWIEQLVEKHGESSELFSDIGAPFAELDQSLCCESIFIEQRNVGAATQYLLDELSLKGQQPAELVVMGSNPVDVGPAAGSTTAQDAFDSALTIALNSEQFPFLESHVIDGKAVLPVAMYVEWMTHAAFRSSRTLDRLL